MYNASNFHARANTTLMDLYNRLEPYFEDGTLEELELTDGILTLVTEAGKAIVVNIHETSSEIWLASPVSGGLHFSSPKSEEDWQLKDGRELKTILIQDLETLTGKRID